MAGDRSFAKLGADLIDLEAAAHDRLLDAEVLLQGQRFASAVAEGLYALEIMLKVLICKRLDLNGLPKAFEVHDFAGLLVLAGLTRRIQKDVNVKANWDFVTGRDDWHVNQLRYYPSTLLTRSDAEEFLSRLRTPPDGVITWLQTQL